jgi:CHAT domain-containing protein/tetratricopeptide (TPR) repeat protein
MERALSIREETLGPEHHFVGRTLNGLSALYADMGRYDESIALAEQSLAIMEKVVGAENSDYARALGSIASIEEERGNLDAAEGIRQRQLEINVSVFGRGSVRAGNQFNDLADIYAAQGRYAEAESLYHESIASFRAVTEREYPYETWPLTGLGNIYTTLARYEEADSVLSSALDVWEEYVASHHVDVNFVFALENMCRLKRVLGRDREALELAKRAFDIRLTTFLDNSRAFAESEALTFSYLVRISSDLYLSCLMDLGDRGTASDREGLDVILATKGEVSDAVLERQQILVREEDPVITAVADTLRLVKVELSGLFVEGPEAGADGYAHAVDSLSRRARYLETKLARLSDTYREHRERRGIGIDRVEQGLPEGAALLEYYRFNYINPHTKEEIPHYLAGVISRESPPALVDLGQASAVERLVENYLAHMQRIAASGKLPSVIDKIEYDRLAADIYSAALRPVAGGLADGQLLLIAPDGALNLLSFAGLTEADGEYLVGKHAVHYLSSGRDVLRLGAAVDTGRGLFVLGNPDFDLDASVEGAADREPVLVAMRNVRSTCADFQELSVDPLPGTQREVERVASAWEASTSEPVEVYLRARASEENFRLNAPGSRVIHLATHGYYLSAACRAGLESQALERNRRFTGENPLLHSGLLFSGANAGTKATGRNAGSDGVLTAYEVSAMELGGIELVVLSACETGLGEVKAGEGVYGLRRAFQVAGARAVVSALWPVSDDATAELMGRLYRSTDDGLARTLRQAQLESIHLLRENDLPDHPFTWAAFIAVGDWE